MSFVSQASALISGLYTEFFASPTAVIPSLGVALLVYMLVTRQLDTIQDEVPTEEFGTAGERNEWLGGPTSEWLGV